MEGDQLRSPTKRAIAKVRQLGREFPVACQFTPVIQPRGRLHYSHRPVVVNGDGFVVNEYL